MNRIHVVFGVLLLLLAAVDVNAGERPFPYHSTYASSVIKPSHVTQKSMDRAVKRHYAAWKTSYLRNLGGEYWVKYIASNTTVSEAHGYGIYRRWQ